jgi:hypothetical protein
MKFRLLFRITIAFALFSCCCKGLFAQKKYLNKSQITIKKNKTVQVVTEQMKKAIRDSLFKEYYKKYQNELMEYGAHHVVVDSSNGVIRLSYVDANNEPSYAPLTEIPDFKNFIQGDLNNDNFNDLVVSVYHSQNGRPRLDIYCYISKNKQLQFYKMYTGRGLGICKNVSDTSGRFFPAKIVNGEFIGGTDCYSKNDPGCCPSLEMVTYFKFENGLKFVRQEPKKKTK